MNAGFTMSDLVTTLITCESSVWPSEEGLPVCSVHREQISSRYECTQFADTMEPESNYVEGDRNESMRRTYIDFCTFLQHGIYTERAVLNFSSEDLLSDSRTKMVGRIFPNRRWHEEFAGRLGALGGPSLEDLRRRGLCQNEHMGAAHGVHCNEYDALNVSSPTNTWIVFGMIVAVLAVVVLFVDGQIKKGGIFGFDFFPEFDV